MKCRNMSCFSGKYLTAIGCVPLLTVTNNLRYQLEFKATAYHVTEIRTSDIMHFVDSRIMSKLLSVLKFVSYHRTSWTDSPCEENNTENHPIEVFFEVDLFVADSVRRIDIEQKLNNFLTRSIPDDRISYSILLSNYANMQLHNASKIGCKADDYYSFIPFVPPFSTQRYRKSLVSNVLLCRLITLGTDDYNITENNTVYLMRKDVIVDPSQYEILPDRSVRVCYEYLKTISFFEK